MLLLCSGRTGLLFYLRVDYFLFHALMASEESVLKHTEVKISVLGKVECA